MLSNFFLLQTPTDHLLHARHDPLLVALSIEMMLRGLSTFVKQLMSA